jgi:hypothetical protein
MSDTKFTQGEWVVGEQNGHGGLTIESDNFRIATVYLGIVSSEWKWGADHLRQPKNAMTVANAYLIAAAPDMYTALNEVYDFLGAPETHPQDDSGLFELSALVRQVLAKARGEQ